MQASRMIVGVIAMMITACTIWEPSQCPNGMQCPPGTRCAASQDICIRTGCGDGVVEDREGEECDDGNTSPDDGCSSTCMREECGNGIPDPAEQCDDGNSSPGDGCSSTCMREVCGNGILDPAEMCDDGNKDAGDGCSETCLSEYCGNSITDSAQGEVCDDGNEISGDGCSDDCRSTEACGNGITDTAANEVCDDGAEISGDGCSLDCRSTEVCGNSITDTAVGEVCDDGDETSGDGCSADCRSTEVCSNGIIDTAAGEVCDDGNDVSGDGCSSNCGSTEVCGNGITDTALVPERREACDDGNTSSGDGCSSDCLSDEVCGNGIIDTAIGEVCDDGNLDPGDGCSANCESNERCGNGIEDPGEGCDCGAGAVAPGQGCKGRQNSDTGGLCNTSCQPNCGDGELDDDEECDGAWVTHEFCTDHGFDLGLLGCDGECRATIATCQEFGWSEMDSPTVPIVSTLRDIWGTGPSNIFAVGDDGAVVKFNGSSWEDKTSEFSLTGQLKGISGTGPDDIWVVGDDGGPTPAGRIYHFNGSGWTDKSETLPSGTRGLSSVWTISWTDAIEVIAVSSLKFLHHLDSMWTEHDCHFSGPFSDIWGTSPNDVVAVGSGDICRYDGTSWRAYSGPFPPLHSVWNRYAVGAAGYIYRRDSDRWIRVEDTPTDKNLHGVWVAPQGNVFAVGSLGTILEGIGFTWTDVSVLARDFFGVWGTHPNNVFAVGAEGQIWRRGATWSPISLSAPEDNAVLDDVSMDGNTIYTVGNGGKLYVNGDRQLDGAGSRITVDLHGIWLGPGRHYAVGDNGTIYRDSGSSSLWPAETTGSDEDLKSIWGGASDIFVVGAAGTILRRANNGWEKVSLADMTEPLNSVWGSSDDNVYAVGDNGTILRFDGISWARFDSPTMDHLRSVWVSDAGDVFVLSSTSIWRRDGSTWQSMQLPEGTEGLQKLRGTAPDDIFAVGSDGQVLHYNGVAWAPIATRTFSNFRGLWVTPEKVVVVGESSYELARMPR